MPFITICLICAVGVVLTLLNLPLIGIYDVHHGIISKCADDHITCMVTLHKTIHMSYMQVYQLPLTDNCVEYDTNCKVYEYNNVVYPDNPFNHSDAIETYNKHWNYTMFCIKLFLTLGLASGIFEIISNKKHIK